MVLPAAALAERHLGGDVDRVDRARDRVAVRAGAGVAEQRDEVRLQAGADRVLEAAGLLVHLGPRNLHDVGEQPFGQPVPPHDRRRVGADPSVVRRMARFSSRVR